MRKYSFKLMQQNNNLYRLQVFEKGVMIKEWKNLEYEVACERLRELDGEGRKDAASS